MSEKLKKYFQIILFLSVGVLMLWLAYRGQDIGLLFEAVSKAKWEFIVLAGLTNVISHYFRALRWQLMLTPLGYNTKKINLFFSVMIMYFANLAIPRSGEVVRCGIVKRYENIPFATALGTVACERAVDLVALLLLTLFVFFAQSAFISQILENNPQIVDNLNNIFGSLPMLAVVCALAALIFIGFIWYAVKKNLFNLASKLKDIINKFKEGLLVFLKLENKFMFIIYTIGIWFIYFFTLYLAFLAFDFTSHLSLMSAMTLSVLGTFGVVIPSPGGIGTWHFIAIEILYLWGIERNPDGGAYALAAHGIQDITFIIVGVLSLWLLPFINRNGEIVEN